jgi:hypothetical protein
MERRFHKEVAMRDERRARRALVAAGLVVLQLASWFTPTLMSSSAAQTGAPSSQSTKPPVQRGQEYYEQSRFDEAIGLLRDLVDRGALAGEDLQKARELLARSYVKKGYPVQAKEMFVAILRTNPEWRPDPIRVPPDETAVFDQALKEFQSGQPAETPPTPADTIRAVPPPPQAAPARPVPVVAPVATGEKKSIWGQWWLWAGAAALVGGVALAAGGGGSGDGPPPPPDLSFFPPPPP